MHDPARVRDLFDRAIQLPPGDRATFLTAACGDNVRLRREIDRLVASYDELGDIFETDHTDGGDASEEVASPAAVRVGAYRIVREIGRGGAGAVYLALRDDDEFKKEVAIKLLRGAQSSELVRRFRHERQILANIEHPNVAKLLDGGSTPQGDPYLVMEYIDGLPIDAYCDRNHLDTAQRLELFCKVCAAVHFAHQHLVVHRDIKPGNILVTADGEPKLLDFGIAKLLDPAAFSLTVDVTLPESRLMTPEYASPEQIRGEPVTTASDVYSLGVVLYRLLTGRRPYRVTTSELRELARAICDQDPQRPSAVVGFDSDDTRSADDTRSSSTRTTTERSDVLRRRLRGDLDQIVLKALRKEPDRRYASVEQLADDIQRHLADLPVRAASDTVSYRARKFVRRHKAAVAAAAGFVMFITGAAVLLAFQSATIARERDRAEASRAQAERAAARVGAINDFLLRTLGSANPMSGTGRDVTLAAALSGAASTAQHSFASDPEIEAGLLNVVGMTFIELGKYDTATPLLERALALRTKALGSNHLDVAESLESKATLVRWKGEFDAAEQHYGEALAIVRAAGRGHDARAAQILHGLGLTFSQRGDDRQASKIFAEALALVPADGPGNRRLRAEILSSAGVSQRRLEQYQQAEAYYREALAIQKEVLGGEHPEVGTLLNNLGVLMNSAGRFDEAAQFGNESLRVRKAALGEQHPYVANSMLNLAVSLESRGDADGAARLYEDASKIVRAALGPDHPRLAQVLRNWGVLLGNQNKMAEAVPLLREALRIRRVAFNEESRDVADALTVLAYALRHTGSLVEGEALTRRALAINMKVLGPDTEPVAVSHRDLGSLLCATGRVQEGLEVLRASARFFDDHPGVEPRSAAITRGEYGECLTKARRFADAETELLAADRHLAPLGPNHRYTRQSAKRLADLYKAWGKPLPASLAPAPAPAPSR
jgi:serine/threonine protein kinase/Tfp pilus assembly protein PilF